MLRRTLAVVLTIVAILAAGWLALRRADIPYDTLETAYALPQTQFLTLDDGLKVHFTDTGPTDRSTLILVHGFSASLHTWNDWRDDLDQDFRVITLDLPGHGLTRADPDTTGAIDRFVEVVIEVADKLDVTSFTLAGNSMGGNTAWKTAVAHPDRIEGLILVDASGWPETAEEAQSSPLVFRLLANPLARSILKDIDMTSLVRSGLQDSYTDQSFVTDELVQRYVDLSRAPGHRATLLSIMAGEREPATSATLSMIDAPTLILWGSDDKLVPVAHAQKFADAIPNAKTIIYEGVGHLPQEEVAAQSVADVRTFMMDVEWQALDEEVVESAGDPRLVEDRDAQEGG
ncbi:MAG: alpha/beta hydrolase [Henriciella sp.]|nr:alpha/beta hydrolase [Henriciella sp.]